MNFLGNYGPVWATMGTIFQIRHPTAPVAVVNGPLPYVFTWHCLSVNDGSCWCKGPMTTTAGVVGFRWIACFFENLAAVVVARNHNSMMGNYGQLWRSLVTFGQLWATMGNYEFCSLVTASSAGLFVSRSSASKSSAFRSNSLRRYQYHLPWKVSLTDRQSNAS